jgi:DNA-binding PadR family transcriptional regulator
VAKTVTTVSMGRFGETAMWVLVALRSGPAGAATILDTVRRLDGQVGPATLFGALARLERLTLIERMATGAAAPAYRLAGRMEGAFV